MSYKDIKVTYNGGFYVESKDLFKNKKQSLKILKKLRKIVNNYKNKPMPFY